MWSYYGTKTKIVKYYPSPTEGIIIEPFAGAARYSLFGENWKKDIVLIDKYPVVVNLWNYLIKATKHDILSLPNISNK